MLAHSALAPGATELVQDHLFQEHNNNIDNAMAQQEWRSAEIERGAARRVQKGAYHYSTLLRLKARLRALCPPRRTFASPIAPSDQDSPARVCVHALDREAEAVEEARR